MSRRRAGPSMGRGGRLLVLILAAGWANPGDASPQGAVRDGDESALEGSVRVLAAARASQADFERTRRRLLPVARSSRGGRCDERIGRFCLTHDDDGDDWKIPPEHTEIRAARAGLIVELEGALEQLPADDWINAQLIRYLVEARRHPEAVSAAMSCRATAWWCHALLGFAYHDAGRPEEAESAFEAALLLMDVTERLRWEDLSFLLTGEPSAAWRRLGESERRQFAERFWTLSDPFLTRPGNELRSEHLARHVRSRFLKDSESPDGSAWRPDQQEVLIRYGWPLGWERTEAVPGRLGSSSLIAHLGNSPLRLLPPPDALLGRLPVGEWDEWDRAPRAEYEIPLRDSIATWIFPLEHQFAVFRREGGAVLVAAFALPPDVTPAGAKVQSSLGIVSFDAPDAVRMSEPREQAGGRGTHIATMPPGPTVVASLELVAPDSRQIARARQFLSIDPAPAGIHLSDLLLIDAGESLPDSLAGALARARGSSRVTAGEEVGVFWELYGLDGEAQRTIGLALTFDPVRPAGILRRIAESFGLSRSDPIRLEWEEDASSPLLARSMSLRIPLSAAGEYSLELTARLSDGAEASTRRILQVVGR